METTAGRKFNRFQFKLLLNRMLHWSSLLLAVIWLSYALFSLIPSDPARLMLGANASQESVALLRETLGLNRPIYQQLIDYTLNALHFDFGQSLIYQRPVVDIVAEKFAYTASISLFALMMAVFVCFWVGCWLFVYPQFTKLSSNVARTGALLPAFLLATLTTALIGFCFPAISLSGASFSVEGMLVGLIAALVSSVYPMVLMLSLLIERMQAIRMSTYFLAARAQGYENRYLYPHVVFYHALPTLITALSNHLGSIFFATIVVEIFFSIPGSGVTALESIQRKDFPLLEGLLFFNALFFISVNIVAEALLYRFSAYHGRAL